MELYEIVNEASTAFVEKQYDTACCKYKKALKLLSRLNIDIIDSDQFAIEYILCITLLESGTLQDILQALETLIKFEKNTGNSFPSIYYAMGKAYIKLYRFNNALDAINKGLTILKEGIHFQEFYIPMTSVVVEQSTKEGLLIALMNLRDEALSWHCPDAKCYIENCQHHVPHCTPCRDIFFSDPSFTGLVIVTCNHPNNPCKFKFHPVCWKFYKEKLCKVLRLTDKEIIGNLCFTKGCENNGNLSIITKIEIYDNNAEVTSTIGKSIPEIQLASNSPVKGAIKKYSPQPLPKLRRPNLPCHLSLQQISSKEEPLQEGFDKESRLAKLIKLRETNFNISHGKDLGFDEDKLHDEYLDSTTDVLPDLPFKDNNAETMQQSRFLFEILYEFIKSNSVVHIDKVLSKWHETKEIMECVTGIDEFLDSNIMELILRSPKLIRIGNYICIPETLQQTLQIFEHEIIQRCKFVLQIETYKVDCVSQPAVDNIISHKEIVTNFENQTDQNPQELLYSTNNVNENNSENNNNICQNSDTCMLSVNVIGNNTSDKDKKNSLSQCKETFDWNFELAHNFFITNNPPLNGDIQTSGKENEDKMHFVTCDKNNSFDNCNYMKRNNQHFSESIIHENKTQSSLEYPFLNENMAKDTLKDNSITKLTNNKLTSMLITLQEKYTQLMTNYFTMEQNMTKFIKEKADMEQNFKLELDKKDSIMEAIIDERKILIKQLETYKSCIVKDIPAKNEVLNKIISILKSEITRLKQENLDNEHNIELLAKEKSIVEDTFNKESIQLLETVKHCQAEINKKNAQLITLQENNLEFKKCMLQKSLESQFLYNQSVLLQGIKHCQIAVEILSNLNSVVQRHTGIVVNYTIWLEALNQFQTQLVKLEENYLKLKSLSESKAEIEKMDSIVMATINLPPYPSKPVGSVICDAFMMFYRHMTSIPRESLSVHPSSPLLLNPVKYIRHPMLPNSFHLPQFSNENKSDKSDNSDNSNNNVTKIKDELEKKQLEDEHHISQKSDLNKENDKDPQSNLQHTNNSKKEQFNLKDNFDDIANKLEEYIKDNQMITETKTNGDCSADIIKDGVSKTSNESKSVIETNDVSNNTDCKLLLESKVEEAKGEENVENVKQENNQILVNSTDKVMNILRNKYTGMSDLLLLKSLYEVRKQHNGSLTGIPLNIVIHDVEKYVLLHQIDHLCTYVETKKTMNNTTVFIGSRKQSKNKVKRKSSSSSMKIRPLKGLSFQGLGKTSLENQKYQHESILATSSGVTKKEPVRSTKCPWDTILKPETNKNSYDEAECVICMENLQTPKKLIYTLDCQHKFHKTCIKEWFQQNQSCPTCRIHCTIDEEYPPLP